MSESIAWKARRTKRVRLREARRQWRLSAKVDGRRIMLKEQNCEDGEDAGWAILVDGRIVATCHDRIAAEGFAVRLPSNDWDASKTRKAFYAEVGPRFGPGVF